MSNFELVSYTEYPLDQYSKAICTVRVDGKYLISFAQKTSKMGGIFWAPATHQVMGSVGVKEYVEGFLLDSRADEKQLMDFVKSSAKRAQMGSVGYAVAQAQAVMPDYPASFSQNQQTSPEFGFSQAPPF